MITKKLFYKKYLYKVQVPLQFSRFLKTATKKDLEKLFTARTYKQWNPSNKHFDTSSFSMYTMFRRGLEYRDNEYIWKHRKNLYEIYSWIKNQADTNHTVRYEIDGIHLYTNSLDTVDAAKQIFKKVTVTEPKNEQHRRVLTEIDNVVICNHLPYHRYKYKIQLKKTHKLSSNEMENFVQWLDEYGDEIKVSDSLRNYIDKRYYDDGKFMYSTDDKLITFLNMFLGDKIKETFVYMTEEEVENYK